MAAKRETITIRSGAGPTGASEPLPKAEIRRLLTTSQLELLKGAGTVYRTAAGAVVNAVVGLEDHIGAILTIWQGPDADKARTALALLDATGRELATKLAQMGQSLETFAGYIPPVIAELDLIKVDKTDPQVQEKLQVHKFIIDSSFLYEASAIAEVENTRAQDVLKRLNERILGLYTTSVPDSITYELPEVTAPAEPGASPRVEYGSFTSSGGDGSGSVGVSAYGGRDATARPDDEAAATAGTRPVDQGGGPVQPGGVEPPAAAEAPAGPPGGDQDQDSGAGTAGDDTAPPVIGAEDRTAIEDDPAEDGSAKTGTDTETAAFEPAPPTISHTSPNPAVPATTPAPVTTAPVTTPVVATPVAAPVVRDPVPVTTPPGVPPVIGSPKAAPTPAVGSPVMPRGGSAAGLSGMPYLPMMGGVGAVGEESGDLQRATYLSEDKAAWNGGHDVTDPVIR
ncbi:hypothetical protein ACIBEJ_04975 [Nonomuraea sp. NPDC050790]|uniref:hypothetical protein n=1 Tax=Nonomuraea sp. NPDC050790 TaxID=3364371 RepID=UPI00378D37B5